MKAIDGQDATEGADLERRFQAELPHILVTSDSNLEAALAILDRYLDEAPGPELRKSLLGWKGRLYLEHGRHEDAARELRAADGLQLPDTLRNFNVKFDLADALAKTGNPQEACAVLTAGLREINEPDLLLKLLDALARITSSSGQALPPGADVALESVKRFYGIRDSSEAADLLVETARVAKLVHDASMRFDDLRFAVQRAETPDEKARLIEEYLGNIDVAHFKQLAEDLLREA